MKNWSDILVADTLPPPCAQVCVEPCTPSSEDCLYLNIFIPSYGLNSSEPLPVAIWYHGGGFSGGSGGSILYDGRHIVEGRDSLMLDPYNLRPIWHILYWNRVCISLERHGNDFSYSELQIKLLRFSPT